MAGSNKGSVGSPGYPLEVEFFTEQSDIGEKALEIYEKSPGKAKKYLTDPTKSRMEKIVKVYRDLLNLLITKYSNNIY